MTEGLSDEEIVARYNTLHPKRRTKAEWDRMVEASRRLHQPIYEQPNHPHYGPVRRLWVILVQLDMLEGAERFRHGPNRKRWDKTLSVMLDNGSREAEAQRWVLQLLSDGWV